MSELIVSTDLKESQRIAGIIEKNLKTFNESKVGSYEFKPFTIYTTNKAKDIIGGLYAKIFDKICLVETVWVLEEERKKGLGTKIFQKLEAFLKEQDCKVIQLATTEFQGRQFYETLDFSVVALLPDEFKGYTTYIMRKNVE